ncbi:MAG TPA: NADH:flavin oxidoreductase [Proteobacteria bacterium]|nr:NADH:flavin oxidoreductase [Pseudomonadota bacterium]
MPQKLFTPVNLGRLVLKNRFVRSATWDGKGETDGSFSRAQVELYKNLSAGGAGLLTSGYIAVDPAGRRNPEQNLLCRPHHQQSLKKVVQAGRAHDTAFMAQLVHCGGLARSSVSGLKRVAPSALKHPLFKEMPQEIEIKEIKQLATNFGEAAGRAREAGCDGVQIHAAHGYLISQFLSPFSNQRRDDYGGDLENRGRFLEECYLKIREYVGSDFAVTMKINGSDYLENGLELKESLKLTQHLAQIGLDAVEVSGGTQVSSPWTPVPCGIKAGENEAPFLTECRAFAENLSLPVIAVGGIRSLEGAARVRDQGATLISLCRPLIREPDLIRQWQAGRDTAAACCSCNRCFIPAYKGRGISCLQLE